MGGCGVRPMTTPPRTAIAVDGVHQRFRHAIEGGWLVAAVLVPAAITHEDFMVGFIQMPKVFVLRTVALYLIAVIAFGWALRPRSTRRAEGSVRSRLWRALSLHPARAVYIAAGAVLVANLVSVAFAAVKSIAIWGIDPGWDTYAFSNVAAYLVIFGVMATHLQTKAQVLRLVWALTATSMVISLYALGQHFSVDLFRNDPSPQERVLSTFGNPLFMSSYLLMTMPLTVALFLSYRDRMSILSQIWIGAGLIALQATAIAFSLSRGPWAGVAVAEITFVILLAWVAGGRHVPRRLGISAVAGAIVVVMIALPVVDRSDPLADGSGPVRSGPVRTDISTGDAITERLGSFVPAIAGGLSHRFTIWTTAAEVYLGAPWVDTERFPELPELRFRPLRPIVGYGPDMFRYAYALAGEGTYFTYDLAGHGHNFVVHTALELGLLGVASYAALIGALAAALFRMLRVARTGVYPAWFAYLLVGLASALAGRIVEQITGKAQVADLTLSWMLAALVVAMSVMRFEPASGATADVPRRSRRSRRQPMAPFSLLRIGGASAVALAVLVLWVQAVVADVQSARVLAQADQSASAGLARRSIELYSKARDLAPAAPAPRLGLAVALFDEAGREGEDQDKLGLLQAAYREVASVLDRNPLDRRARVRAAEFQRELSVVEPGERDRAVRDNQILAELSPASWLAHAALAWSYVALGQYERGLETALYAERISADADAGANRHIVYFVKATALQGLGRTDEAIAAAERSLALSPLTRAQHLLRELTGSAVPG